MEQREQEFRRRLLATFKGEAEEHISHLGSALFRLQQEQSAQEQAQIIEAIYREAHSLKGAARTVDRPDIERLCQSIEEIFSRLKRGEIGLDRELFRSLSSSFDRLTALVLALLSDEQERPQAPQPQQTQGATASRTPGAVQRQPPAEQRAGPTETVRVDAARLDALLLQAEGLLEARMNSAQLVRELEELNASLLGWEREYARTQHRPGSPTAGRPATAPRRAAWMEQAPANLIAFLDRSVAQQQELAQRVARLAQAADRQQRLLAAAVDRLLNDAKHLVMQPFASVLEPFPRFVRDLSRDQGKEVDLRIRGEDLEMDRRILAEMKDVLTHLLRNALDHVIDPPREREARGKPPRASLVIAAEQRDGNQVEVIVADDGAGIDPEQIRFSIASQGHYSTEELNQAEPHELLQLLFRSGVSTSPTVTPISGRGLGLAIVREKVERLGGSVTLESQPGAGTTFRLLLPFTIATVRSIIVEASEQLFALPTSGVRFVGRAEQSEIRLIEQRETLQREGKTIPLLRLADILGLRHSQPSPPPAGPFPIVLLGVQQVEIALRVDALHGEQELIVKSLGPQLRRVRNIAGATVLSGGRVVPILNLPDLIRSAGDLGGGASSASTIDDPAGQKMILLADDSITARTLLRNILESAGYRVRTATDGASALTELQRGHYDLLVSDVDMPRMNGFELAAAVRADRQLQHLPIVLVTALSSEDDRRRGMETGADAYLVKSNFEQSNLLEALKRLI